LHINSKMYTLVHLKIDWLSAQYTEYLFWGNEMNSQHLPDTFTPEKPRLLDQVRNTIRTKHYSLRTEEAYVEWIKRFIFFHNKRHPNEMGAAEINQYISYLAVNRNVAASTQNQALCAILFLYKEVLSKDVGDLGNIIWAKKPKRLPVVFTREEMKAVLSHISGDKWLMAQLLYGSGLRLIECLRLRVKDIDFGYKQIVVRNGKGDKDRITMLPEKIVTPLHEHIQRINKQHQKDLKDGYGSVYLP